jgi:hypothetical protein
LLSGNGSQASGHCEDQVEVGAVQQSLSALGDPLCLCESLALWAVSVAARIPRAMLMATATASVVVSA